MFGYRRAAFASRPDEIAWHAAGPAHHARHPAGGRPLIESMALMAFVVSRDEERQMRVLDSER